MCEVWGLGCVVLDLGLGVGVQDPGVGLRVFCVESLVFGATCTGG